MSSMRICLKSLVRSCLAPNKTLLPGYTRRVVPNYVRNIHTTSVAFAGHSKWQNIKHTKASKDAQKSQLYNRLIQKIKISLTKGHADPRLNTEYGNVLEECRKANMPSSTIDKAVKRALEKKYFSVKFEIVGPENSLLVIDAEVDNRNFFRNEVRKILRKYVGFGFADEGRAMSAFEEKGVVRVRNKEGTADFDHEKMEEIAIEADAEEVRVADDDDTILMFIGDQNSYTRVKTHLENDHADDFVIVENGVELIPYHRLDVSEATMEVLSAAIDQVGELEGVNRIYTNV